jgi:hypothetical protein
MGVTGSPEPGKPPHQAKIDQVPQNTTLAHCFAAKTQKKEIDKLGTVCTKQKTRALIIRGQQA